MALANTTRRQILEMLLDRPLSAGEIASKFSLNRPAVSEQVHLLQDMGLVTEQVKGRQRFFSIRAAPLQEVADWIRPFERYWRGRLRALSKTLDEEEDT